MYLSHYGAKYQPKEKLLIFNTASRQTIKNSRLIVKESSEYPDRYSSMILVVNVQRSASRTSIYGCSRTAEVMGGKMANNV